MIQIQARGNSAQCTHAERLTSGMVGLRCEFVFDEMWDGLTKTAVFLAGNERRDMLLTDDICTVPWEVLKLPGYQLMVGVYGFNADGTLVIPTVYANCGSIAAGADPCGDEGGQSTPTLVEQIIAALGATGATGPKGETGPAGYTPVRGKDYWTEADKASIVQDVISALPNANGVSF